MRASVELPGWPCKFTWRRIHGRSRASDCRHNHGSPTWSLGSERHLAEELCLRRVLFVDDSNDLRQIMEVLCESLPAVECICAASMSAVLERAPQVLRTDLAILDVNLGYGQPNGLQIYRWLIGQHYAGEIVFLSGHARTDPDVEEASTISGVHFFEKPLGLVEVEGLILGTA